MASPMPAKRLTVNRPAKLLIADFPPTRLGVRMALADQQIEICAEAGDVAQAIAEAQREQPDMCLVGSDLPGGGMAAVRGIQAVAPGATIVVLAAAADPSELVMASPRGCDWLRSGHDYPRATAPRVPGSACGRSRGAALDGPHTDRRASLIRGPWSRGASPAGKQWSRHAATPVNGGLYAICDAEL